MSHVTCLAAEAIRILFPRVDRLEANLKMVLLRAPSRVALFNEKDSLLPLEEHRLLLEAYYARGESQGEAQTAAASLEIDTRF